jgi:hypothetical protein
MFAVNAGAKGFRDQIADLQKRVDLAAGSV